MGLGKMAKGNPMLFNFIKVKSNPSEENINALRNSITGVNTTQQAEQASSFKKVDEKLPMSKIRRRALDSQSTLNNEQTLLGG
jgi:hypothetical protein